MIFIKKTIVDFKEFVKEYTNSPYYNGGWVKKVDSVDLTKSNGYCFVGDFITKEGLVEIEPGYYIICDIEGSRHHPEKSYLFVKVSENGDINEVFDDGWIYGRDWALKLRDRINQIINKKTESVFNVKEYWDGLELTIDQR